MTHSAHSIKAWKLAALAAATVGASFALSEGVASAQEIVKPTAKGVVGGALIGAEAVMITEALIGVKPWWAYAVGGGVGAIGGGIGGYFIEQAVTDGKAPLFMLAGGLALVIPTLVLTLNATRYVPTEGATEDKAPTNEPKADPGTPGGSAAPTPANDPATAPATAPATPPAAAPTPAPQGLMDVRPGTVRLGVPMPVVTPVFTVAERRQFGMRQETEVRVPVFNLTF
jgi:hypothetical protein